MKTSFVEGLRSNFQKVSLQVEQRGNKLFRIAALSLRKTPQKYSLMPQGADVASGCESHFGQMNLLEYFIAACSLISPISLCQLLSPLFLWNNTFLPIKLQTYCLLNIIINK